MHSIKSKKSPGKKLLLTTAALLLLTAVAVAFAYTQNLGPFTEDEAEPAGQKIDYNEPTEEQVKAGEEAKEETVKDATKPSGASSGSQAPTSTGKKVGVEITRKNRTDSTLSIGTLVQEINSTGLCTLTLTKPGQKTITQTAKTQVSGTVSTCKGFMVNGLEAGEWTLKIDYKSNNSYGSVTEKV